MVLSKSKTTAPEPVSAASVLMINGTETLIKVPSGHRRRAAHHASSLSLLAEVGSAHDGASHQGAAARDLAVTAVCGKRTLSTSKLDITLQQN